MSEDLVQATSSVDLPPNGQLHAVPDSTPSDFAFTKSLLGANVEFQKAQSRILELEDVLAAQSGQLHSEWFPIETAPKDRWHDDPNAEPILIGCFYRDRLVWAIAAQHETALYGYIQCASRTGWTAPQMPPMANGADRERHPGEWIIGKGDMRPTHWAELPAPPQRSGDRPVVPHDERQREPK